MGAESHRGNAIPSLHTFRTHAGDNLMIQGESTRGPQQGGTDVLPPNTHLGLVADAGLQPQTNHTIPLLDALRSRPTSTQVADHFLQGLEATVKSNITQKNLRKSGRYNIHEIPSCSAQYRWPNEGINTAQGRRRLPYDELSIPQWVAGQLTNILQVCDPNTQQSMINQVIATMKDAASLPWLAARAAYAHSMTRFLKCGRYVCKVFGCRLMVFCLDSASICSELIIVSGVVIFF